MLENQMLVRLRANSNYKTNCHKTVTASVVLVCLPSGSQGSHYSFSRDATDVMSIHSFPEEVGIILRGFVRSNIAATLTSTPSVLGVVHNALWTGSGGSPAVPKTPNVENPSCSSASRCLETCWTYTCFLCFLLRSMTIVVHSLMFIQNQWKLLKCRAFAHNNHEHQCTIAHIHSKSIKHVVL